MTAMQPGHHRDHLAERIHQALSAGHTRPARNTIRTAGAATLIWWRLERIVARIRKALAR